MRNYENKYLYKQTVRRWTRLCALACLLALALVASFIVANKDVTEPRNWDMKIA